MDSAQDISLRIGQKEMGLSLLDGLLSRRSVHPKRLIDPGPDMQEIQQIICAAATATDHCSLKPWRFIAITGNARESLAEVFVQIKLKREPGSSLTQLARERDRARAVPVLVAVIARLQPEHPLVPLREQYASVGAAIQNMLLCVTALGYGAKMVSGKKCRDSQLSSTFSLNANETLFGFLCIGTAVPGTSHKPRISQDKLLTVWYPDSSLRTLSRETPRSLDKIREPI